LVRPVLLGGIADDGILRKLVVPMGRLYVYSLQSAATVILPIL